MEITEVGIMMEEREEQYKKAISLMVLTEVGMDKAERE
jgi:hypothetical protein